MNIVFLIILLAIAFIGIITAEATDWQKLRYVTKPFIMPVMALLYTFITHNFSPIIIAALGFSFGGDIFLLWPKNNKCFLFGLIAFLIAHGLYIYGILQWLIVFHKIPAIAFTSVIIYFVIGICIFNLLKKGLGKLKIPVIVYMSFLLGMSFLSMLLFIFNCSYTTGFVFTGSIFFIISDSILALHNFRKPKRFAGVYFMITYVMAQAFIVIGFSELF
ncbi:MAG TPA: lysoplasmalogenase [Bacteroidales bacterium]|nr:lysoplasmalogenase [Bacteroidales bacterium]